MKIQQYSRLHEWLPIWQSDPDALESANMCHRYTDSYYLMNFMFKRVTFVPLRYYRNELGINHYLNFLFQKFQPLPSLLVFGFSLFSCLFGWLVVFSGKKYNYIILFSHIIFSHYFPVDIIFLASGSLVLHHKVGRPALKWRTCKCLEILKHLCSSPLDGK